MVADVNYPDGSPLPADGEVTLDRHVANVAELFREHNRALVGFLKARLRSEQDAREVAQEAYVKLLQLGQPGAVSFLRSYLFKTAANLATDRLRQRQVRRGAQTLELFGSITDEQGLPESNAAAIQELSLIRESLNELPERLRDVFIRHRVLGESEVAIAKHYGVTDRMVRHYIVQTLFYCRARLDGRSREQARERLKK